MNISIFMKFCVKYHKSDNVYVIILEKYAAIVWIPIYYILFSNYPCTEKGKNTFQIINRSALIKLHYKRQLILRTLLNQTCCKLSVKHDFGKIHNPLSFINGDAFIKPY